jgi:CheY-like chemotaxis protein
MPRGTEQILVVEDEPTLREIAAAVLSEPGYRSLLPSAEEALARFGRRGGAATGDRGRRASRHAR